MNPQRVYSFLSRHKSSLFQFVFPVLLLALCVGGVVSSTAQSPKAEREFDNKIPAHVPIKVKLKNVEKVKDLENDDWLRDFEIEVTNTGTKPIYYLRLGLFFVDVQRDAGGQIGYTLRYGRNALISIAERATPEDVPILPGETHTFKLHEDYVKGWKYYRTQIEKKPHPKKVGIRFEVLNYGDGTGFLGTDGLALPEKRSSDKGGGKCGATVMTEINTPRGRSPNLPFQLSSFFLPAYFLPVNFYPMKNSNLAPNVTPFQSCCTGLSCTRMSLFDGGIAFVQLTTQKTEDTLRWTIVVVTL